jgi:hypothetical protein
MYQGNTSSYARCGVLYTLEKMSPTLFVDGPHWLWQVEVEGRI